MTSAGYCFCQLCLGRFEARGSKTIKNKKKITNFKFAGANKAKFCCLCYPAMLAKLTIKACVRDGTAASTYLSNLDESTTKGQQVNLEKEVHFFLKINTF